MNRSKIILLSTALGLIILGSVYLRYIWSFSINTTRSQAQIVAETAASAINGVMIRVLGGLPSSNNIAYDDIKGRLMSIKATHNQVRAITVFMKVDEKLVIVVDSEPVFSKDFSNPGQECLNAGQKYLVAFNSKKTVITKPYSDRWGHSVSILVPMVNPDSGEINFILEFKYFTKPWKDYALFVTIRNAVLLISLFLLLLAFYIIINKNTLLKRERNLLETSERRLKRAQELAHVGNWELDLKTRQTWASEEAIRIFGINKNIHYFPYDSVNSIVHPDDRPQREMALKLLLERNEKYDLEFRIIRPIDGQERVVYSNACIEYDENGHPEKVNGVIQDITERKISEQELLKKTEELDNYFTSALDLFCIANTNGYFIKLNKEWENALGYTIKELEGKKFFDFIHPDDIQPTIDAVSILTGQNPVLNFINRYRAKDGSYRVIEWRSRPSGNFIYAAARDITERIRMEEALRESEEKHRLLIENSHEVIYTLNKEGVFLFVSQAWINLLGHPLEQVIGQSFKKFIHPDDISVCHTFLDKVIETGNQIEGVEYRVQHKNGEWLWHTSNAVVLRDASGVIIGLEGIAHDITERKRVEKELKESEKRYNLAIEGTAAGLWDWDMVHDKVNFSHYWKSMLGYADDEISNDFYGWKNLWHPDDVDRIEQIITNYVEGKSNNYEVIHRLRHKNGEWRWILTRGVLLKDANGNPQRWIGTNLDITEQKLAEEKIKSLLAEKEIILKEVHHRIRNNMNTIRSLLNLQAESVDNPDVVAVLKDAGSRVQVMMVLYEKLYQSVNTNEISIQLYFKELIQQIINNFPNSDSVRLNIDIDNFILDVKRLSPLGIIMNELLTNIMKYAFNGRNDGVISIAASLVNNQVSLIIEDNGNGIPDNIDFENSTGFGLMLVGLLTKQLDGNIRIERHNGTKITLEFEK